MHVYVCLCVHVDMYVCVYLYMHVCMCMRVCVGVYMHLCLWMWFVYVCFGCCVIFNSLWLRFLPQRFHEALPDPKPAVLSLYWRCLIKISFSFFPSFLPFFLPSFLPPSLLSFLPSLLPIETCCSSNGNYRFHFWGALVVTLHLQPFCTGSPPYLLSSWASSTLALLWLSGLPTHHLSGLDCLVLQKLQSLG